MNSLTLAAITALLFFSGLLAQAEDELPQRLQVLLDSYESEKERVLMPVERKLDTALVDLRNQYTKSGRLQDALAVNNLISTREAEGEEEKPPKDTRWRWGSGGELMINGNGKVKHTSWNKWGSWEKQEDGSLRISSEHGYSIIKFTDENNGIVSTEKGGGTTLTRIEED